MYEFRNLNITEDAFLPIFLKREKYHTCMIPWDITKLATLRLQVLLSLYIFTAPHSTSAKSG
jgi:hypothetical protein